MSHRPDPQAPSPGSGSALRNPDCPLCGQPNNCLPASCGRLDVDCWCRNVTIAASTLARVPAEARGLACICAECARQPAQLSRPAAGPNS